MDWQNGPGNVDYIVFKHIENIRQNHQLHDESDEILDFGINCGISNPSKGKNGQKSILELFSLSLLLFVSAKTPFSFIVSNCTGGYKFSKSPKKTG